MPAVFVYMFFPLFALPAIGFQMRVFGKSRVLWTLFGLGLLWGVGNILQPYAITWVPHVFIANRQQAYLVCRALVVLLFASISLTSILRKSQRLKSISHAVMLVLLGDLMWALLAGRYVGP